MKLHQIVSLWVCLSCIFAHHIAQGQVIIGHPSDTSICSGNTCSFSIIAVNATQYQWQEFDGIGWYDLDASISYVSGYNTAELSIHDAITGLSNYLYRCYVKNNLNQSDTSDAATLTVHPSPVIQEHPLDYTACKNETATFHISAINVTQYQWQENSGSGWFALTDNSFYSGTTTQTLHVNTSTGMTGYQYRCIISSDYCESYSEASQLTVYPLPIIYNVIGGGSFCDGGNGVYIGLNNSETGMSYELLLNEITTGIVVTGNGGSLDFGLQTEVGVYTIMAINGSTSCKIQMNGFAEIERLPLPQIYTVSGSGDYCEGDIGVEIFLDSSEMNIVYELFYNGLGTEQFVNGNGSLLSFGIHSEEGTYTVYASNPLTQCANFMTGNVQVVKHELPLAITSDDIIVPKYSQVELGGQGSGGSGKYTYNWAPAYMLDDPQIQTPLTTELEASQLFTFQVIDTVFGCISLPDTQVVIIQGGDLALEISATPNILCIGDSVKLTALASGGTGLYNYVWTSIPEGFNSTLMDPSDFPLENITYYVTVSDGNETVSSSIDIFVHPKPEGYQLLGGGIICPADEGVDIYLEDSDPETLYTLVNGNYNTGIYLYGNGGPLYFGKFHSEGEYFAEGISPETNCREIMPGNVTIEVLDGLIANAGDYSFVNAGQSATLSGTVEPLTDPAHYHWEPEHLVVNPFSAETQTVNLTETTIFTFHAIDDDSGCFSNIDSTIVFVNGGDLKINLLAPDTVLCKNSITQIFALGSGGSGSYQYNWSSSDGSFSSTLFNPVINPETSAWYIIHLHDGISTVSDSVFISVNDALEIYYLTGGGSFCPGDPGVIIGLNGSQTGVTYYLYRNGTATDNVIYGTGSTIEFPPLTNTGFYTIEARSGNELCNVFMEGYANVRYTDNPEVFNVIGGGSFCANEIGIPVELTGSETGVVYELYRNGTTAGETHNGTGLNILFNPQKKQGIYTVRCVKENSTCYGEMFGAAQIIELPVPLLEIIADTSICKGDSTTLNVTGAEAYIWNTDPPQITNELHVIPSLSTNYEVEGISSDGCKSTESVFIQVDPGEEITIIVDEIKNQLNVQPSDLNHYQYLLNGVLISEGPYSNITIPNSVSIGDTITVIAFNKNECSSIEDYFIDFKNNVNAFTPNDDGYNDFFMKGAFVQVFDRWGKELFAGEEGWDGKYKGKRVAAGTYYFVQPILDINGNTVATKKGSVTVIYENSEL